LEPPKAATAIRRVALLPTGTSPKSKRRGLALICPGAVIVKTAARLTTVPVDPATITVKRAPLSVVVVAVVV
jgi:hypothetical protein